MGRYAGWIALHAGVAGGADAILIPEMPFDLSLVAEKLRERDRWGSHFSIVVVAEGAIPKGGKIALVEEAKDGRVERLGGIGAKVADALGRMTGKETRSVVLGHLQRGGAPTSFDRILATRFGGKAVELIRQGDFGKMVAFAPPDIVGRPLEDVVGRQRLVPLDSDTLLTAKALCDGKGNCPGKSTASCGGYRCDETANECKTTCAVAADCANGWSCEAGACKKNTSFCSIDALSLVDATGVETSCKPYRCKDAKCQSSCSTSDDCSGGTLCSTDTKTCVPPEPPSVAEDGGGSGTGVRHVAWPRSCGYPPKALTTPAAGWV